MRKNKKINNHAFTLVEMLAVIVILGILMIISFPKIIEMVNREQDKIDEAQLELIYSATKSYLFDHSNQYPAREGNSYCIDLHELETGDYLAIEADEFDFSKRVKVSYFSDDEYQLNYVESSSCSGNNGEINTALAGLTCTVNKSGYSIDKTVTVNFPTADTFTYEYSLDEGKTWKTITKFDQGSKSIFKFYEKGSILAKVKDSSSGETLTCSAYVDQIDSTPIGTILIYAGNKVPSGYLLADGSALRISQYSDLYNAISTTYGRPKDKNTFNLPNLKGKVVVGMNADETEFDTLGETGGKKAHLLNGREMPSHTHTASTTTSSESGAHTHGLYGGQALVVNSTASDSTMALASGFSNQSNNGWWYGVNKNVGSIVSNGAHTHDVTGATATTGSSEAHNNLQPYITLKYIIKYQ